MEKERITNNIKKSAILHLCALASIILVTIAGSHIYGKSKGEAEPLAIEMDNKIEISSVSYESYENTLKAEKERKIQEAKIKEEKIRAEKIRLANEAKEKARLEDENKRKKMIEEQEKRKAEAREKSKIEAAKVAKEKARLEAEKKRLEAAKEKEAKQEELRRKNEQRKKEAEAKRKAEQAKERERTEAHKKKLEDERRVAAMQTDLKDYIQSIHYKINSRWDKPNIVSQENCKVTINQDSNGFIINYEIKECKNETLIASIEDAIKKSNPLPTPIFKENFNSKIEINFSLNN